MAQQTSSDLYESLSVVRRLLGELEFPFHSASAADTGRALDEVETLLDHYLLVRLKRMQAPLQVALAGATGSGKSTLVNALAGQIVSSSGVLRPTTRMPVHVYHPADAVWFGGDYTVFDGRSAQGVPRGLSLLDTPSLDVARGLSGSGAIEALTGADAWLFVTTAARYADAVPWELLLQGAERRVFVAVVINRVPSGAVSEIRAHLGEMLADRSLGEAPLFIVEECELDSSGMVPPEAIQPVADWVADLAAEEARRAAIMRTVDGAVDSVIWRVTKAVTEADEDVFDEATRADLLDAVGEVRGAWEARG
ncbi:hypothetical protein EF847_05575 [Actinobacteria bacterium YIM 96077]|uniref:G domain-containing protein n=1 Tax=Phytoactinopolyspora halophila TaxID=1981511 RepID=A0A329QPL8_9ACTN|nr:GTPase [Phytoactinopolyspora halophila]AYY12251.1 hypothetical protein EF847_05575 [Actinobacteria bacterium YIM 96077]RAW13831.1 hypothetical protein DPM12_12580 [Phytoactinopolyspora halophila]